MQEHDGQKEHEHRPISQFCSSDRPSTRLLRKTSPSFLVMATGVAIGHFVPSQRAIPIRISPGMPFSSGTFAPNIFGDPCTKSPNKTVTIC
jgi:hypothetical protein